MKTSLIAAAFCFLSLSVSAQAEDRYKKQWQDIDSIIVVKDLPETALQKVNVIYNDAKKKGYPDEVLKALLYKLSLQEKNKESDINQQLAVLQNELKTTTDIPSRSVLRVMLANELYNYYQKNFWRNRERKDTKDSRDADITAWSNGQLSQTIDSFYSEALAPVVALQKTSITGVNAIIIKGNTGNLRPSLYDVVAHEALDYYKTEFSDVIKPRSSFTLTDSFSLAQTDRFLRHSFTSGDTGAHMFKAVRLFQQLIHFHKNDADPSSFIDVDIERIRWAYILVTAPDKDSLYKEAMRYIANRFPAQKSGAEAWFALAEAEAEKADDYSPFGDTVNRYGYAKAKTIIEQRLRAMPDSCYGNTEMKRLLNQITKPELVTVTEAVNIPGEPFRVRVEYKNIDTLYMRVLWQRDKNKAEQRKSWNQWRDIATLPFIKTYKQLLPNTSDYQKHSVEIKTDALPSGDYILLFSNHPSFSNRRSSLAMLPVSVSQLAFMRNGMDYFVMDRETGQPLKDVRISGTIEGRTRKSSSWVTKTIKPVFTDGHGHARLPLDNDSYTYGSADLLLRKGGDTLSATNYLYNYSTNNDDEEENDSDYEEDNSHVYFFTDRSIYRPGQTVWFKGIITTKDKKTKRTKLYHYTDSIEVDLFDANSNLVDSQFVRANEFGSFSGRFTLPQQVLTGEFSIETVEMEDGEATFNVEEYKRPLFYIAFDTVKESYRLYDTITITGSAKAFAGNAVDGAKVTYHIRRSASFPHPYLFWNSRQPYSPETDIADSTIATDADGNFIIRFIATPDLAIERKTEPSFNFSVELSVTDANGETHEAETDLRVAYQAVQLQVEVPKTTGVNNFRKLFITTKNSAGENIPADVKISISPLHAPAKAYRKRLWTRPDQYVMSREEFEIFFPYDEYGDETDYQNWEKEEAVVKDTFNTTFSSGYTLPQILPQGWYCMEATTKDKDGSEVKDIRYIQLYDIKSDELPAAQTEYSQIINNSGAPGDSARLLLGSSESDVFVVTQTKKAGEKNNGNFSYTDINNSKKEITYTIRSGDDDRVGIWYSFIKHNRFYTGGMRVYTNRNEAPLNITYTTYRNRTEPGNKETWTVQLSDSNGKAADAELLTGMYDASLDQFKKHDWSVPYTSDVRTYVNNEWNSDNFTVSYSEGNGDYNRFYRLPKLYDHIAGSASEFWSLYNTARARKVTMVQFTPPNIVADEEVKEDYDKEFKVLGVESGLMSSAPVEANGSGRVGSPTNITLRGTSSLNEVVVTGYGIARKKDLTGSVSVVTAQDLSDTNYVRSRVRSLSGVQNIDVLLVVTDSVITDKKLSELNLSAVDHIDVLKSNEARALYGDKAASGAVLIFTRDFVLRSSKKKQEQALQVRRNFSETAFFYPQLHADRKGNYSFSFTMPDAVTTWKWMSLAHDQNLTYSYRTQNILSQKTLMVQPNLPRFLREGDSILLTAKISNLSDSLVGGKATLILTDAITNQSLNDSFNILSSAQSFSADAGRSAVVIFPLRIPASFTHPLVVKVTAAAGGFSDGEEKTLPVLSRRQLITETLPLFMPGTGEKQVVWNRLKNVSSSTLTHESLTVEYTPDPVWQVVQSLPYLMEYPHQCAEQTFNRFYANTLASHIIATHPQIQQTFKVWLTDTTAMQSPLEMNPELKSTLLNETPWVEAAADERAQKRNLAQLFDRTKLATEKIRALEQLKEIQLSSGAFPWFGGGGEDRYITQYILAGIGKLQQAATLSKKDETALNDITTKALFYLDRKTGIEYADRVKKEKDAASAYLSEAEIQYWYMRSFFTRQKEGIPVNALSFFVQQSEAQRAKQTPYMQGMMALALNRLLPVLKSETKNTKLPADIIRSLEENAVTDSMRGMYWKANEDGYRWYQSAIESQSLLIDAFSEITPRNPAVNAMQQWLIMNKQTNHWSTTKSTADACYALLMNRSPDSLYNKDVSIRLGDSTIATGGKNEASTGYIKHRIDGKYITPAMANITVSVKQEASFRNASSMPSYGAVYWQYFEDMDKVTAASSSPLSVSRLLFIETNTAKGKQLQPLTEKMKAKTGDKLIVRMVVKSDREMDYIQLTDTRAAAMEPVSVLSGYQWQNGLGYYQSTKDVSTNFFIGHLPKGTYVLEYPAYITHSGLYSAGMSVVQCMYAPQFAAHSGGTALEVIQGAK